MRQPKAWHVRHVLGIFTFDPLLAVSVYDAHILPPCRCSFNPPESAAVMLRLIAVGVSHLASMTS